MEFCTHFASNYRGWLCALKLPVGPVLLRVGCRHVVIGVVWWQVLDEHHNALAQ